MAKMTLQERLDAIAQQVYASRAGVEALASILADTERAIKRADRRAEALPEEYERVELVQARGPVIAFNGRVLAETRWDTRGRDPMRTTFELYETAGGNWVASSSYYPIEREGLENVAATVIERQDDEEAMRVAVLDHFQWHDRARAMLRKQLGWPAVVVEVD